MTPEQKEFMLLRTQLQAAHISMTRTLDWVESVAEADEKLVLFDIRKLAEASYASLKLGYDGFCDLLAFPVTSDVVPFGVNVRPGQASAASLTDRVKGVLRVPNQVKHFTSYGSLQSQIDAYADLTREYVKIEEGKVLTPANWLPTAF